MGDQRRLLSEELHDLYSSPNTYYLGDNKTEIGGACGMYGGEMKYEGLPKISENLLVIT